ncbi:hypothetical protein KQH82_08935 [bacterium]|nr:hypothetical protein [bacterium]
MMRGKLCLAAGLFLMLAGSVAMAGEIEKATEKVDAQDARSLYIECEFGAGELLIRPASIDEAAILNVTYEPDKVAYDVSYHVRDGVGELYLESDLRKRGNVDNIENSWELTLTDKLPTELHFEIGACDAEIDLGGVPLTELKMDIGAASGLVEFSKPNPERLREISIDVGASSIEFNKLGNANFEYLSVDCGAASLDVDFRGELHGESVADFDIGMGSADIVVPEGYAVRIETDDSGWFSSVDFDDLDVRKVSSGIWETAGFEDARDRLTIRLDVGMGSVDIRAR